MCNESAYALGSGFHQVIYQRCLAIELERANLNFQREVEHTIYYDGINVGKRRADFVVERRLVIELKAVMGLEDAHLTQTKNYLIAYGFEKGLLSNFGSPNLQYKLILIIIGAIIQNRLKRTHIDDVVNSIILLKTIMRLEKLKTDAGAGVICSNPANSIILSFC